MPKRDNLQGNIFKTFKAVSFHRKTKYYFYWELKCVECGNTIRTSPNRAKNLLFRDCICIKEKNKETKKKKLEEKKKSINKEKSRRWMRDKNPNWNGGIADYKNHYIMKKKRKFLFEKHKGICQICGNEAKAVHHIDISKDNHSLENLIILCHKCHGKVHKDQKRKNKTSKWRDLTGYSLKEMSEITNFCFSKCIYEYKKNPISFVNLLKKLALV